MTNFLFAAAWAALPFAACLLTAINFGAGFGMLAFFAVCGVVGESQKRFG